MNVKQKILKALDCALEDVSDSALIDVLLDAYRGQKNRIRELEGENAAERERLNNSIDCIRRETKRMREDPLYCAKGDYYFECNGRLFCVEVAGFRIDLSERKGANIYPARQLSREEWLK